MHVCKTISCGGASESFNNSSFEPHLSSFSSPSPSHDQDRPMDNNKTVGEVVDDGLFGLDRVAALLCESTPSTFSHAILNLYSVLYGISPLRSTAALKSAILSSSTTDTAKTPAALTLVIDLTPFISAGFPQQALEECLEDIDSSVIIEAYMNLLRTHRVTTELILSDVAKETVNFTQKFKDLTPSDILICCLELRAKRGKS